MFTLFCRWCWREEQAGREEGGSSACRPGCGAGGWCPPELWELPARASCCKGTKINVQIEGGGKARVWFSSRCKICLHSVELSAKLLLISDSGTWVAAENSLITKVHVYRLKCDGLSRFTTFRQWGSNLPALPAGLCSECSLWRPCPATDWTHLYAIWWVTPLIPQKLEPNSLCCPRAQIQRNKNTKFSLESRCCPARCTSWRCTINSHQEMCFYLGADCSIYNCRGGVHFEDVQDNV